MLAALRLWPLALPNGRGFATPSLWTFAQLALSSLCALGVSMVLARSLGPAGQGQYHVITAALQLTLTLGNLGFGAATLYHLSHAQVSAAQAARHSLCLAAVLGSCAALALLAVVSAWGAQLLPGVPQELVRIAAALLPAYLAFGLLSCCLQGQQRFAAYNALAAAAGLLQAGGVGLLVLGAHLGVAGALGAQGLAQLGCACGCAVLLLRHGDIGPWWPARKYLLALWRYGGPAWLGNALTFCLYRLNFFLLNALADASQVGIYGVAVGVAERLWLISYAASTVLLPRVAQTDGLGAEADGTLTAGVCRHVFWLTAAAALGLAALSPYALPWLFGAPYAPSVLPLWCLLPGILAGSTARLLSNDLAARGRPGHNAAIAGLTVALHAVLGAWLIPRCGVVGASCAVTCAYLADCCCKTLLFCRVTHSRWWWLWVAPRARRVSADTRV
jgi:O-antigen/teichoic acid export membrane protein